MQANGHGIATTATGPSRLSTRDAIAWSIGISVLLNVVGLFANLLPGMGDIPGAVYVVGSVFAALALVGGWAMWSGKRWGYQVTFWVTVVNTLLSIGAFTDSPTTLLVVLICVGFVLCAGFVVLMRRADVRSSMG
jgi:hypothetical protein